LLLVICYLLPLQVKLFNFIGEHGKRRKKIVDKNFQLFVPYVFEILVQVYLSSAILRLFVGIYFCESFFKRRKPS